MSSRKRLTARPDRLSTSSLDGATSADNGPGVIVGPFFVVRGGWNPTSGARSRKSLASFCSSVYFVLQSEVPHAGPGQSLADISAMRSQMARGTEFRGYGPVTLAATGMLALLAAAVQALWLPDPAGHMGAYLAVWLATAAVSAAVIRIEMVTRSRRVHSELADEMIHSAVEQFLPAAVAATLLTMTLLRFAPETLWMLPGLWQIVFSLGVFAACRTLPRPILAVGAWYLVAGLTCLAWARDEHAFSPLAMGLPFGLGQLFVAGVLRACLRGDDAEIG